MYRIEAAREEDVRWAAALGQRVYHGADAIAEWQMLEWFRVNPHGFSTLWASSQRVGNFDLLPLRPAAMAGFAGGQLREADLRGADLFPVEERGCIRALHFESIALDPDFSRGRPGMMKAFVLRYMELLERVCPVRQLEEVTAIAASDAGAGVLRRLGFTSAAKAEGRADGHPLYRGTPGSYSEARRRFLRCE